MRGREEMVLCIHTKEKRLEPASLMPNADVIPVSLRDEDLKKVRFHAPPERVAIFMVSGWHVHILNYWIPSLPLSLCLCKYRTERDMKENKQYKQMPISLASIFPRASSARWRQAYACNLGNVNRMEDWRHVDFRSREVPDDILLTTMQIFHCGE